MAYFTDTMTLRVVLFACFGGALVSHATYDVCPSGPRFANGQYDHFWMMCSQIYGADSNNDHKVTKDEHFRVFDHYAMTEERKLVHFLINDLNGDGVIDVKDDPIFFSRSDLNHDTVVSYAEDDQFDNSQFQDIPFMTLFERVRARLNVTSLNLEQYKGLLSPLNETKNGAISKVEFRNAWFHQLGGVWQEFRNVFPHLDFDKDDIVSKSDLSQQFPFVDENKDGMIEYHEVYRIKGPYPS